MVLLVGLPSEWHDLLLDAVASTRDDEALRGVVARRYGVVNLYWYELLHFT